MYVVRLPIMAYSIFTYNGQAAYTVKAVESVKVNVSGLKWIATWHADETQRSRALSHEMALSSTLRCRGCVYSMPAVSVGFLEAKSHDALLEIKMAGTPT